MMGGISFKGRDTARHRSGKAHGNVHTARFAGIQGLQREDGMASVHPSQEAQESSEGARLG